MSKFNLTKPNVFEDSKLLDLQAKREQIDSALKVLRNNVETMNYSDVEELDAIKNLYLFQ